MKTIMDLKRGIDLRKRAWGFVASTFLLVPSITSATPSTTYWAPSTATCQAYLVPHVTYDTYFAKDGSYPIDTGLTMGVLPFDRLRAEVGFDLLYSSQYPVYFNAKLGMPESALFRGSPAVSAGIYSVGTKSDVSDYNVLHAMAQESLPFGGYISLGVYHGLNERLFVNSDGDTMRTGLMAAIASPDVQIGLTGLRKLNFVADVQTGKNAFGAWGFGSNVYFADNVSLLVGPVFFLDQKVQPAGSDVMWTVQLDIDFGLDRSGAGSGK